MLELELQVQPLGTPSAILGMAYQYGVSVWLPQTDDSGLPSYQGVNYTPYASQVCTCSALFPISSGVTSSIISLSLVSITALALNFPATIVMQVQFSQAQTALLSTSSIQLAFNNGQLDSRSGCQFIPNSQIWLFQTLLASTLSLTPQSIIPDFTTPLYTLTCTNIIFLTNSLTVQISWLNTLTNTILQQSSILPLITTLPNTNTILGNILHQ